MRRRRVTVRTSGADEGVFERTRSGAVARVSHVRRRWRGKANGGVVSRKGVETKVSTKVAKCDFAKKRVETVTGEIIEYDSLVIATGVSAHKASFIEGHDGKMCKVLRSHEDALEVVKAMDAKPKNPVVVGGGYIGLEVAAVMCARGLKPTVVLMESNVMSRLFTKEIAAHYEQLYESKGATFIKNASVKKINDGKSVILNDGRELNADLVILGVGSDVQPNVEPFGDELEKAKDGGIKVNGKFETSQKTFTPLAMCARSLFV